MREKMNAQEKNKPEVFDLIRDVLEIDEKHHISYMKAVKHSILDDTSRWSAKLTITGKYILKGLLKNMLPTKANRSYEYTGFGLH